MKIYKNKYKQSKIKSWKKKIINLIFTVFKKMGKF